MAEREDQLPIICTHRTLQAFIQKLSERSNGLMQVRQVKKRDHDQIVAQLSKNGRWQDALIVTVSYHQGLAPYIATQTEHVPDRELMRVTLELHRDNMTAEEAQEYTEIMQQFEAMAKKDRITENLEGKRKVEAKILSESETETAPKHPPLPPLPNAAAAKVISLGPENPLSADTSHDPVDALPLPRHMIDGLEDGDGSLLDADEGEVGIDDEAHRSPAPLRSLTFSYTRPRSGSQRSDDFYDQKYEDETQRLGTAERNTSRDDFLGIDSDSALYDMDTDLFSCDQFAEHLEARKPSPEALEAQLSYVETAIQLLKGYLHNPHILAHFEKVSNIPSRTLQAEWTKALKMLEKAQSAMDSYLSSQYSFSDFSLEDYSRILQEVAESKVHHILGIVLTHASEMESYLTPNAISALVRRAANPLLEVLKSFKKQNHNTETDTIEVPFLDPLGLVFPSSLALQEEHEKAHQALIEQKHYIGCAIEALKVCLHYPTFIQLLQKQYGYPTIEAAQSELENTLALLLATQNTLAVYIGPPHQPEEQLNSEDFAAFESSLKMLQRSSTRLILNQVFHLPHQEMALAVDQDAIQPRGSDARSAVLTTLNAFQAHPAHEGADKSKNVIPGFSTTGLAPAHDPYQARESLQKEREIHRQNQYLLSAIELLTLCQKNKRILSNLKNTYIYKDTNAVKKELQETLTLLQNLHNAFTEKNAEAIQKALDTIEKSNARETLSKMLDNLAQIQPQDPKDALTKAVQLFKEHSLNEAYGKLEVPHFTSKGLQSPHDRAALQKIAEMQRKAAVQKAGRDTKPVYQQPERIVPLPESGKPFSLSGFSAIQEATSPPLPPLPMASKTSLIEKWKNNLTQIGQWINIAALTAKIRQLLKKLVNDVTVATKENGDYTIQGKELGRYDFTLQEDIICIRAKTSYHPKLLAMQVDILIEGIKRHSDADSIAVMSKPAKPLLTLETLVAKLAHESINVIFKAPLKDALHQYVVTFEKDKSKKATLAHIEKLLAKEATLLERFSPRPNVPLSRNLSL